MTIDPKRIERLWEACPELRPEGVELLSYGVFVINLSRDRGEVYPDDWTIHALIRDKIVCGLASDDYAPQITIDEGGSFRVATMKDDEEIEGISYDFTLACILAAERVLGLPEWEE